MHIFKLHYSSIDSDGKKGANIINRSSQTISTIVLINFELLVYLDSPFHTSALFFFFSFFYFILAKSRHRTSLVSINVSERRRDRSLARDSPSSFPSKLSNPGNKHAAPGWKRPTGNILEGAAFRIGTVTFRATFKQDRENNFKGVANSYTSNELGLGLLSSFFSLSLFLSLSEAVTGSLFNSNTNCYKGEENEQTCFG